MNAYVTDTNALIWNMTDSPRLTDSARQCFDQAEVGETRIYIPIICIVELIYLSERNRIPADLIGQISVRF